MDLRQCIGNQNDVSLGIARHVGLTGGKDSNLVLSPLSINVVLSLVAAGSKGAPLDQLLSFLKSKTSGDLNAFASELISLVFADGSPSGGPCLSFANALWIDKTLPLKPSFKEIAHTAYKASPHEADFRAKAAEVTSEANSWAEKVTNGLIKEVLPPGSVDATTRLIFANALYFKGAWNEKFNTSMTKDYDFHLLDGSTVQVPFMTSKKKQLISTFEDFKVLGLSYKQGGDKRSFSMYFFLPDAKDGLQALIDKVGSDSTFLDHHLPSVPVTVGEFRIPKFKISFGLEASAILKKMGLVLPFTEGGLSEMADSPEGQNLYVSSIYHKSFIEVNEEGTEAAAASVGVVALRAILTNDDTDFIADHPFMFVIREDMTGVVLFIGHVLNPLAG